MPPTVTRRWSRWRGSPDVTLLALGAIGYHETVQLGDGLGLWEREKCNP